MPLQTVNCFNFQREIPRNYLGWGKISLKIRIDFFYVNKKLQQVSRHSDSQKYPNRWDSLSTGKIKDYDGVWLVFQEHTKSKWGQS